MARHSKSSAPSQSKKFIEKARELGCDEDPKAFKRTFSTIVPPKKPARSKPEKKKPRTGGARGFLKFPA
jgi:hypothetical protein